MNKIKSIISIMMVSLVVNITGCGKDEIKAPEIVSTKEVVNGGHIIVEATFDDASRMYFTIISSNEAEVTYANKFYFEDETDWKYEGDVVIPKEFTHYGQTYRVVGIGYIAFYGCESITSVDIPETVSKYISNGAFANCSELVKVKMPSRLEELGEGAFSGCKKLTSINLPEGVKAIYQQTFSSCESLTSIHIPNSVETIGFSAFALCKNMETMEIPSVTTIAPWSFLGCENLKEIKMPAMKYISQSAFSGCTSLSSVVLPATTAEVMGHAFADCTSLTSVTCQATVPPITYQPFEPGDDPFIGCPIQEIKVQPICVDAYKTADGWKKYADFIVGY
jgi:hypothetical protein